MKLKYEKPVILILGEIAKGAGNCAPGNTYNNYSCSPGAAARNSCGEGISVSSSACNDGSSPVACGVGTNGVPGCLSGSNVA